MNTSAPLTRAPRSLVAPLLSAACTLSACTSMSAMLPGGGGTPRVMSGSPATPAAAPAVCARSLEALGKRPETYQLAASGEQDRALLRSLLRDADRRQFVAAPGVITQGAEGVPYQSRTRPDKVIFTAGEPLLVVECSTQYQTVDVLTLDLRHVANVKFEVLDLAPTTFVVPTPPPAEVAPSPKQVFERATAAQEASVPSATALKKQYYDCDGVGFGACQKAEAGVAPGPELEERKAAACATARRKALARCMPRASLKKLDAVIAGLQAAMAEAEDAFFAAIATKLR